MRSATSRVVRSVTMHELDDGTFIMTVHDRPSSVIISEYADLQEAPPIGVYRQWRPTGEAKITVEVIGIYGDHMFIAKDFEGMMEHFREEAGEDSWGQEQLSLPPSDPELEA